MKQFGEKKKIIIYLFSLFFNSFFFKNQIPVFEKDCLPNHCHVHVEVCKNKSINLKYKHFR